MNLIGAAAHLAILRLHEQEFEIIRGSQILGNSRLAHRIFPEDIPLLPTQSIPVLLVIIDDRAEKVAFELFQRHSPGLCRFLRIVDTKTRVGQTPLKTLRHPAKESLYRPLGLSRQLHRLPLWQKEFSPSPIHFILCTGSSLRSSPTDTIGGIPRHVLP